MSASLVGSEMCIRDRCRRVMCGCAAVQMLAWARVCACKCAPSLVRAHACARRLAVLAVLVGSQTR
eukprot:7134227-Alexandrium_andersonii.AAC.1